MRIMPSERDQISAILHEEIEEANRRISDRLSQFQSLHSDQTEEGRCGLRQFYEDLTDKAWTDSDEESLRALAELPEGELKRIIREAYRRSPVHPVPGFSYLVNLLKKIEAEANPELVHTLRNPDAVSAADRERLANLLSEEMSEAAHEIASRLQLANTRAQMIRERLKIAEGNIIGRFTPLV